MEIKVKSVASVLTEYLSKIDAATKVYKHISENGNDELDTLKVLLRISNEIIDNSSYALSLIPATNLLDKSDNIRLISNILESIKSNNETISCYIRKQIEKKEGEINEDNQ